jgi:hypothetical protein
VGFSCVTNGTGCLGGTYCSIQGGGAGAVCTLCPADSYCAADEGVTDITA